MEATVEVSFQPFFLSSLRSPTHFAHHTQFNKMESALSPSRSPIQDPKGEISDPDAFLREFTVKRKWKDNDDWGGIGEEEEKELEEEDMEDEEVDR